MAWNYDTAQSSIYAANASAKKRDAINALQGLAFAICYDGEVSDAEIAMLRKFLADNREFADEWPFDHLWATLRRALDGGLVTPSDRTLLLRTLREFETRDNPDPSAAIFDDDIMPEDIRFPGAEFVITGTLESGTRKVFTTRLMALGAQFRSSSVVPSATDYLVVGMKGSKAWKSGRYGTKIEAAMGAKKAGAKVRIIREDVALEAMLAAEANVDPANPPEPAPPIKSRKRVTAGSALRGPAPERLAEDIFDLAQADDVDFERAVVVLTGDFRLADRWTIEAIVEAMGASLKDKVSKAVNLLIVGDHEFDAVVGGSHTTKVKAAIKLRDGGHPIVIVPERVLLEAMPLYRPQIEAAGFRF